MLKKLIVLILVLSAIVVCIYLFAHRTHEKTPDWRKFNANIFANAKRENKLVVLHLGANWCHWCHIMEEQTYTDPFVLQALEKDFIACKEDHDARQDLTSLYAEYGWPATIIFDSNGNELFKDAGYIPKERFLAILTSLAKNPVPMPVNKIEADFRSSSDSVKRHSLDALSKKFFNSLDLEEGGFKYDQKYIDFETFEYALNNCSKDSVLTTWLANTVTNSSGIYDDEWGGVFQYSTHDDWDHVHYEKLLSVQAKYIKMYCWYYQRFKAIDAINRAEGTAAYVNRFLNAPNAGYYNAQDADLIPGQKAADYFALPDAERIAKGIPAVDRNIYTSDNAELIEAFIILSATTGNQLYLHQAVKCYDLLKATHKVNNAYCHNAHYTSSISLKDNLAMAKVSIMLYKATENTMYKSEAEKIIRELTNTFDSGNGYLNAYVGNNPLKATYNISENIEACRLLNYCSYVFHEPKYKKNALTIFNFLTNEKIVNSISTEPGILSAADELATEPITATLMIKGSPQLKEGFTKTCLACPKFYFNQEWYTSSTITSNKVDIFDAFDTNFIVLCTSSYCSPPMYSIESFNDFLYNRVLTNNR